MKAAAFLAGIAVGILVTVGYFLAADIVELGWPEE